MWYEKLDGNKFISKLYNKVPELNDVPIINIKIEEEGRMASLIFVMPKFADNPPNKWKTLDLNLISGGKIIGKIELMTFNIKMRDDYA